MPEMLRFRLVGGETGIGAVLTALRGLHDVAAIVHVRRVKPRRVGATRVNASDDAAVGAHDVEVRIWDSGARHHVRTNIQTLAAGAGVRVKWEGED